MADGVTKVAISAPRPWRRTRREYRHRAGACGRLLFVAYLPPGTHIEMRCPACGRMHVIDIPAAADGQIDIEPSNS